MKLMFGAAQCVHSPCRFEGLLWHYMEARKVAIIAESQKSNRCSIIRKGFGPFASYFSG